MAATAGFYFLGSALFANVMYLFARINHDLSHVHTSIVSRISNGVESSCKTTSPFMNARQKINIEVIHGLFLQVFLVVLLDIKYKHADFL